MNFILLSGGSGTRLWPLSNEQRPKQFLPVFKNEDGQSISMLQNLWGKLEKRGLQSSAIIATSASQRELVLEQLGRDVDLVLEPHRRDTFPAILLSVAYLYSHRCISRDEPVAVMPVDSSVDDSFYDVLLRLPEVLDEAEVNVALMGVRPTCPSGKYGYMIPNGSGGNSRFLTIREFHEKPARPDAIRYIEQGALWNCGVFCFRAGFLLDMLTSMGLPDTYEELLMAYSDLENQSFDYAVVEREERIGALVYEGPWRDLGTWCELTKELGDSVTGAGYIDEGSENVHIINELEKPVLVLGLSDVVVAASKEGILVTSKEASSRLKEALARMNGKDDGLNTGDEDQARTVDRSIFADGTVVTTRRIHLGAGRTRKLEPLQDDSQRSVTWTLLHGRFDVVINGEEPPGAASRSIVLENEDRAELHAIDPVDLIEVVTMNYSFKGGRSCEK
jgi:mannose-1-phosphate guanylyltransferase